MFLLFFTFVFVQFYLVGLVSHCISITDAVSPQMNIIDFWGIFGSDDTVEEQRGFIQDLLSGKVEIGCKYREAVKLIEGLGPDAPNRVHGVIFLDNFPAASEVRPASLKMLTSFSDLCDVTLVFSVDERVDRFLQFNFLTFIEYYLVIRSLIEVIFVVLWFLTKLSP